MTINEKLESLRNHMSRHGIDAYIVPTCDFHGSEYIGDYFKTREFISGFTGSSGTAVITMDKAGLWTDGRYFLQAQEQLKNSEFVLMKSGQPNVPTIKEYLKKKMKRGNTAGFDGRMMQAAMAEDISSISKINIEGNVDLVGEIWEDRPALEKRPVWILEEKYSGMSYEKKIRYARTQMKKEGAEVLLLTSLDEIAWLLNLRGDDIKCNPVFLSFMIITKTESTLFAQKEAFSEEIKEKLRCDAIVLRDYNDIYKSVREIKKKAIWLDKQSANFNIVNSIDAGNEIINRFTPVLQRKAVKNAVEIKNIQKAHLLDGVAMTKFIYWLKKNVGKVSMTEISLGKKLEEFRGRAESYIGPSFEPIVAYKEHGAIVHYSAVPDTDYEIMAENIVLIDSGGQYLEGTTDITRTISLGKVSSKMKEMYTAVLRGNLNLASAVFKEGCSGVALDYIARKPLWDKGLDYNHGTGHGVGYLLNVHELPNAFRYKIMENPQLNPVLKSGMITSDEPGVYLEGEFGIRIENLLVCVKKSTGDYGDFLAFQPLTFVPLDRELINTDEMTVEEQKLLNQYHSLVYRKIAPFLEEDERRWLKETTAATTIRKQ
jgi:Xaa-Pro aminopeptidase